MPIHEITDISTYQFSKNPVIAKLETDSYIITPGVCAQIKIDASTVDGANAVGGSILFQWATDSVLFTVASSPDDTGCQVREKDVLNDAQYALQLVEDLSKNYKLSENYTIKKTGTSIELTAKIEGSEFSLYDNFHSSSFGYVINATYTDGIDIVYAENYKMKADLWMEDSFNSATFVKNGTIELDPLDNTCIFDFQTIANSNLSYCLPSYNESSPISCDQTIKKFYIRYIEKYGNPIIERQVNTSSTGHIVKAGIIKEDFNATTDLIENKFRVTNVVDPETKSIVSVASFMTKQPRIKKVRETQQEFLYFCVPGNPHQVYLKITVSFKNGSADVIETKTATTGNSYRVICFPVGFTALGLSTTINFEDVKKYKVQVLDYDTDAVISESFTYIPETDSFIDEHYLLFTQSFGGVDTLRLTGIQESVFDVEKEVVQKTRLYDTSSTSGEFAEIAHQKVNKFKVNTGWITKEQADWLEDLFISEQKYVLLNRAFIPIIIATSALKKYDSKSTLFFYEFDYSLAYKNNVI